MPSYPTNLLGRIVALNETGAHKEVWRGQVGA
jgi:hypothetical protein